MSRYFCLRFVLFGWEIFLWHVPHWFGCHLSRTMPDPEISEPTDETDFDPSPTLEDDTNYQSLADYLIHHLAFLPIEVTEDLAQSIVDCVDPD
jgi:hypothetical protein